MQAPTMRLPMRVHGMVEDKKRQYVERIESFTHHPGYRNFEHEMLKRRQEMMDRIARTESFAEMARLSGAVHAIDSMLQWADQEIHEADVITPTEEGR